MTGTLFEPTQAKAILPCCDRLNPWGGPCLYCEILFGSYGALVALDGVEEWVAPDAQ